MVWAVAFAGSASELFKWKFRMFEKLDPLKVSSWAVLSLLRRFAEFFADICLEFQSSAVESYQKLSKVRLPSWMFSSKCEFGKHSLSSSLWQLKSHDTFGIELDCCSFSAIMVLAWALLTKSILLAWSLLLTLALDPRLVWHCSFIWLSRPELSHKFISEHTRWSKKQSSGLADEGIT